MPTIKNQVDQTKSPYYKVHLTKTDRYKVRLEARRLNKALDFNQAKLILETIDGHQSHDDRGNKLNQR